MLSELYHLVVCVLCYMDTTQQQLHTHALLADDWRRHRWGNQTDEVGLIWNSDLITGWWNVGRWGWLEEGWVARERKPGLGFRLFLWETRWMRQSFHWDEEYLCLSAVLKCAGSAFTWTTKGIANSSWPRRTLNSKLQSQTCFLAFLLSQWHLPSTQLLKGKTSGKFSGFFPFDLLSPQLSTSKIYPKDTFCLSIATTWLPKLG